MTILIIGASGFVGKSLFLLLKTKNVIGTYYSRYSEGLIKLDMTSIDDIESLFSKYLPKTVYMPAHVPGVDFCELNEHACEVNVKGIRNIVNFCKKFNSQLIFFSSDYIFNGEKGPYLEVDIPNPINEYGKTKLKCEKIVQELKRYLIIRTTVVYGYDRTSKNFLMTLTDDLLNRLDKKVPSDQIGSPTWVEDLSSITIKLVENNKTGIYNVVGPDLCSRFVFALKVAKSFGLDEKLIKPVFTKELRQPANRPLRAGLINDKIRKEIDANPLGIEVVLSKLKLFFKN